MTTPATPQTLGQLIQSKAERFPDAVVLRFVQAGRPDEVVIYGTLATKAQKLAVTLHHRGLTRGTTFAVMMRNHPEFVYALVAASLLGAICVPVDPRARGEAVRAQLAHAECRGLLVADYALPQVQAVLSQLPDMHIVYVLYTGEEGALKETCESWDCLNACLEGPDEHLPQIVSEASQALEIMYTSGSTGSPRGVLLDNRRMLEFRALGKLIFGYRPDDRLYTGLSLAHGNAQAVTLMGALGQGIEAVFTRRFTKRHLWDITRTYGVTVFSLLGGMAMAIYSEPVRPNDGDNPVRLVISAGMPAAIWTAFEQRFHVRILEWYGAVEGGFVYKPVGEGPIGSFGRLSPGYDVRVVDADSQDCPPGTVGELLFRPIGVSATVDYWRHPEASAHKTRAGWLHSGDMVHRDAEGYVFSHARQGEAIRCNGEFISPDAIARVLAEHPAVTDVCVYGVPAHSGAPGEHDIVATVVPTDHTQFDPTSIFAACRQVLPANAMPAYLHVVSALPKTLSEKPQKRLLLERFDPSGPDVFMPSPSHTTHAAPSP
jgi:crotonobetaine/carnitine-CoA ligase